MRKLLPFFLFLSACTAKWHSTTNSSANPILISSGTLSAGTLTLNGNALDTVTAFNISQAGVSLPFSVLTQTASMLTAAMSANATVKSNQPINATLSSSVQALSADLTVNLSGTTVTNFTSTGVSDRATTTLIAMTAADQVGIGTTTPDSLVTVSGNTANLQSAITGTVLHVGNADATKSRILIDGYGAEPQIFYRSAGGTASTPTAMTSGTAVGTIAFVGYGTTSYSGSHRAAIAAYAGENWTDSAQGTYLAFSTTAATTVTTSERMRIDNAGRVGIGTSTPAYQLSVVGGAGTTVAQFSDGSATCSITPSSAGNISCTSDERLKRDISTIDSAVALEKILRLRPVQYRWRADHGPLQTGFVAQEVERVAPEFVLTAQDGYKQVGYLGFVPWLTGATQEMAREISELKDKNAELERRLQLLESKVQ